MKYGVASLPTPILNTPLFYDVFRYPLPLDSQNLLRPVEAIALPGTKFCIVGEYPRGVCKVTTLEYPGCDLYIDSRFLKPATQCAPERNRDLPSSDTILSNLEKRLYLPYVWGGNFSEGIQEMLDFYPPGKTLDPISKAIWTLRGLDCSGLLYEATQGCTPRNTSQLVRFGKPVPISGMSIPEIISTLEPLDLIVWVGHVIIVLDERHMIESRNPVGVIRTTSKARLSELFQEKRPVDDWDATIGPRFVLRRWAQEMMIDKC